MTIDWAVWGPPLAVLGAGGLVAWVVLQRMGADPASGKIVEESRRIDLESTRDEVVEALKQLEIDRDKVDPAEYARERERLVARGARAMEALDSGPRQQAAESGGAVTPAPAAAIPVAPPAAGGLAPEWKGALYALLVIGILAILWNFATQNTRPRAEGGSMTGSMPGEDAVMAPPMDPKESPQFKQRLAGLEEKLTANPDDVAALDELCWLYVTHGDPATAMQYDDRALKVDPEHLGAKSCRAVITAMMGMFDKAIEGLDAVLAKDPSYAKAATYRALILLQMAKDAQDPAERTAKAAEAAAGLRMAKHLNPGNRVLDEALREAQMLAGGGAPAAPAGDLIVSGTITIDPAAQATLKGTETLFVNVSDPARPGPPVAAEKFDPPYRFPLPFELTTADIRAMPGAGGVPDRMDLKVRIDLDGNAMSREPGTPQAIVSGVARGSTGVGVALTLDGAAAPPPAPIAGEVLAAGTAKLDPSVKLAGGETVFVTVRDPAGGPPLAAKKVAATFPLQFSITTADLISMGGAPTVPGSFNVAVRVDADGNAMTRDGAEGVATGVSRGTTGIDLTLK